MLTVDRVHTEARKELQRVKYILASGLPRAHAFIDFSSQHTIGRFMVNGFAYFMLLQQPPHFKYLLLFLFRPAHATDTQVSCFDPPNSFTVYPVVPEPWDKVG